MSEIRLESRQLLRDRFRHIFQRPMPLILIDAQDRALIQDLAAGAARAQGAPLKTGVQDLGREPDEAALFFFPWSQDLRAPLTDYMERFLHCADSAAPLRRSRVVLCGRAGQLPSELVPYTEILSEQDTPDVLESMSAKCREHFQTRIPLIMVDTEERELVERIALRGDLVTLLREKPDESRPLSAFYSYLGASPDELKDCVNLFSSREELKQQRESAGLPPSLFILHVNQSSAPALADDLRAHVEAYLHCTDNTAAWIRSSCVLLYGDVKLLAKDLRAYTKIVEEPYPKVREIAGILKRMMMENCLAFRDNPKEYQDVALEMAGFRVMRVERMIQNLIWTDAVDGEQRIYNPGLRKQAIEEEKSQMLLQSGGALELIKDGGSAENALCGMESYMAWVGSKAGQMANPEDYAFRRGVLPLKGLLMVGVPGCGKSEAAKLLHRRWGLPLVRLNMDQLYGGRLGDSEQNLRTALEQAEAMAPCVVWIDEVEKGLDGASASSDGGTSKRLLGRLLSWMQDRKRACFVFATANDISKLPPEFVRRGRFDILFSVFLPTLDQCAAIFREQMERAERLRRDSAKDRGQQLDGPLFRTDSTEESCMNEENLKAIVELFVQNGRELFLSGSDITGIVADALTMIEDKDFQPPISNGKWKAAIEALLDKPTTITYGGSAANLETISASYLRLLRGNFVPASERLLFRKAHYQSREKDGRQPGYYGGLDETFHSEYDRRLFEAIRERINDGAPQYEAWASRQTWQM